MEPFIFELPLISVDTHARLAFIATPFLWVLLRSLSLLDNMWGRLTHGGDNMWYGNILLVSNGLLITRASLGLDLLQSCLALVSISSLCDFLSHSSPFGG